MVIDFHTHIFPEKIAEKTVQKLGSVINLTPAMNGTEYGLIDSMEKGNIDISVVLPVVTEIRQFDSIIRFASYLNEKYENESRRLLSFAGIHPLDPDLKDRMKLIKSEGFKGIKIHPHYQNVEFNDIHMKEFLYLASEMEIPVLTHAGYDPYVPDHDLCTVDMILDSLEDVKPKNLILAHLGNNMNYKEVEEKLCGKDVYLDTAYSLSHIGEEAFLRMKEKHGASKILFATDCPWGDQKKFVDILNGFHLTEEEREMIFFKNAKKLLGLI